MSGPEDNNERPEEDEESKLLDEQFELMTFLITEMRKTTRMIQQATGRAPSSEVYKLVEDLKAEYNSRIETLKHFGFLDKNGKAKEGDIPPPSLEKAMRSLTREEIKITTHFKKPLILLIPETSFAFKVKAINSHKMDRQRDTYDDIDTHTADPEFAIHKERNSAELNSVSDNIAGWRVVIVDGANKMKFHEGDDIEETLGSRIEKRKADRKPNEKGMDRHKYAMLMMESIKNRDPIDQENRTILDDDLDLTDPYVPVASWNMPSVIFIWYNPGCIRRDSYFRSSVGGDVLLT